MTKDLQSNETLLKLEVFPYKVTDELLLVTSSNWELYRPNTTDMGDQPF